MRILVVGAYGFIGAAVAARLTADGHEVIGVGRSISSATRRRPDIRWIRVDLCKALKPEKWQPFLKDVDAVVNCAGVLQDCLGNSTVKVHVDGANALFEACKRENVRRIVHISAVGVAPDGKTAFARTKYAAEEKLRRIDIDWVILRPSLVVGRTGYGGSALLRSLAGIPFALPLARESASAQPVQVQDVARAVSFFVEPSAPARHVLEIAGPQRLSLARMVDIYRNWLGYAAARTFRLPPIAAKAVCKLGDIVSWLGWRPPLRTTSVEQLSHMLAADPDEWVRVTGIKPARMETALMIDPAGAQDRWFARLYFLKPLVIGVLAIFWLVSGVIELWPARGITADLLKEVGFGDNAILAADFAAICHVLIGIGIAIRQTALVALFASLPVALIYIAAGSLMRIGLWLDPLGTLLKMFPLIVLTIVAIVLLDDR